jgi:ribonuclease P protein component
MHGDSSTAGTEEAMSEANVSTKQPEAGKEARLPSPDVHAGRPSHLESTPAQGAPSPLGLIWRIDRRETFMALRRGRRTRQGPIAVAWVDGDPTEPPRVALSVSRRVGSAVVRNRLRRQMRALVRSLARQLAPGAYLIGADRAAVDLPPAELRTTLSQALERLGALR